MLVAMVARNATLYVLWKGQTKGFLADRMTKATTAWRENIAPLISQDTRA